MVVANMAFKIELKLYLWCGALTSYSIRVPLNPDLTKVYLYDKEECVMI